MRVSPVTLVTVVVTALLVAVLAYVAGPWWTLGIMLGIAALLALVALLAVKTKPGRRASQAVGRRVGKTRLGKRMGRAQLRAEAKRKGVAITDPFGRPLSDIEIQLELVDTAETRQIKRQLKAMNPQQRAQALRMLQGQADEAMRTGAPPTPPPMPKRPGFSGRPVTKPPRSRKKR